LSEIDYIQAEVDGGEKLGDVFDKLTAKGVANEEEAAFWWPESRNGVLTLGDSNGQVVHVVPIAS